MNISWNNLTKEYLLYALLLGIALLYPFLHIGEKVLDGEAFQWSYIFQQWVKTVPFVILLLIHIVVLLPILFEKKQVGKYILMIISLITIFFFYIFSQNSNTTSIHEERGHEPFHHSRFPPYDISQREPPIKPMHEGRDMSHRFEKKPHSFVISGPVVIDTLIGILLLGCSLAIKLMFKHLESTRKMEELENIHVKQELAQLRTQVSPHFLMNSLNNIHGMVEMDSQKAQDMILELSGMMRYMLYESSVPIISLSKEIDFLSNYISLMRARYNSNRVTIQCTFPVKEDVSFIHVPPLIFIILIENAFKHGVDYQNSSFVNIELSIHEETLSLHCMNSFHESNQKDTIGGIGLANLRKRLDIQYGDTYSLDINISDAVFITTLKIPTKNEN